MNFILLFKLATGAEMASIRKALMNNFEDYHPHLAIRDVPSLHICVHKCEDLQLILF